jgi:hypothetical protein
VTPRPPSEVKGAWFVAARAWLDREHPPEVLPQILARMAPEHRHALAEPLPSLWYPEQALADALRALDAEITKGDAAAFASVIEGCTEIGLGRFFRVVTRMASPVFVLRHVPTMWRQIRRGAGQVEVSAERVTGSGSAAGNVVELRYSAFGWFDEPLYEALTVGSVRALSRQCLGRDPEITVTERTARSMTLRVVL